MRRFIGLFAAFLLVGTVIMLPAAAAKAEPRFVFRERVPYEVWVGSYTQCGVSYAGHWRPAWYYPTWGTLRYQHRGAWHRLGVRQSWRRR